MKNLINCAFTAKKKILSIAALLVVVAMTSVTFAQSSLQDLANIINKESEELGDTDYVASVRGNNFVLTTGMDESELNGLSVGEICKIINDGGDIMIQLMLADVMQNMDETDRMMVNYLRENKINLIMHFIGKQSREEGEIVIRYDLLP